MEKNKKYKLTDETKVYNGKTLYRIEALKDFAYVQKGKKGGFVESEENLSQEDDCWIDGDAMVFDDTRVSGHADVSQYAIVCGCSEIANNALVYGHAFIKDCYLTDYAAVGDNVIITNGVSIGGSSAIGGNVEIINSIKVQNGTYLRGKSKISHQDDFITFQLWWKGSETITYVFQEDKWFTFSDEYSTDYLIEYEVEKTNGVYIKTLIEMMKLASKLNGLIDFNSFIYQIDSNDVTKTFLSGDKVSLLYDKSNLQVIIEFDKEHLYKSNDINMLETALKDVRRTLNVQSLYNIPFIKSVEMKLWKKDN